MVAGNMAAKELNAERRIRLLSLRCASVLLGVLIGFSILITVAKPVLSAFVVGDVSVYLVLIVLLALTIWALTWFYMARLDTVEPTA